MKYFDAFCGLGGFSLAVRSVVPDARCVRAVDSDRRAAETYESNFGLPALGDMTALQSEEVEDFDILFGGFPCQPFSRNGKWYNKNDRVIGQLEDRANLFLTLVNLIDEKKPKFFVLENVPGLVNMENTDGTSYLKAIVESLIELNYDLRVKVLDAADHGSPQQRKRLFFVGTPRDYDWDWPAKEPRTATVGDILEPLVEEKYLLSNLWKNRRMTDSPPRSNVVKKEPNHTVPKGGSRLEALKQVYKSSTKPTQPTGRITPLAVIYGDTPSGLPRQQDKLYSPLGLSPTIATFSTPAFETTQGWRQLTPRECARLQGIPDSFKLPQNDSVAYKQIGNAINVMLVSKLINNLLKGVIK